MLKYLPLILLIAGCATLPPQAPEASLPIIIAHRGASAYAPENTLAAFELAAAQGAPWYELDCLLTKDGGVIVIHDADLERTTGVVGAVRDWSLADLQALDAGSWFSPEFAGERMPTLAESLAMAKGRIGVYVEIKNADDDAVLIEQIAAASEGASAMDNALRDSLMALVEASGTRNLALTRAAIAEIRAQGMEQEVVVQSFSPVVCLVARAEAPELRVEFLGKDDEENPARWPRYIAFGRLIGVHGFNIHHESATPERIADFHAHGETVAVYTVNEPALMRRYADWGADGIITDKPNVALETIR
jgi:glycerophosphoryl diester phosphodiesterase